MVHKIAYLMIVVVLLSTACAKSEDRTDAAIAAVNAILDQTEQEVQALTAEIPKITESAAAVRLVKLFQAAMVTMRNRIQGLEKDYPAGNLDRKRMQEVSRRINERIVEIGKPFGAALSTLPETILGSDEMRAAIGQLESLVQ